MTRAGQSSRNWITVVLIVCGVAVLLLAILLGFVLLAGRRQVATLTIRGPVGETVYCDVVIDGRASSVTETIPCVLTYPAKALKFAVVSASEDAANLELDVAYGGSSANSTGPGLTGECYTNGLQSGLTIGDMSDVHIRAMRSSRELELRVNERLKHNGAPEADSTNPPSKSAGNSPD